MRIPVRYPTLVWTAIVAAVFSLVVGLLMTLDFVGRGKYELFDTPAVPGRSSSSSRTSRAMPSCSRRFGSWICSCGTRTSAIASSWRRACTCCWAASWLAAGGRAVGGVGARHDVSARPVDPEADAESTDAASRPDGPRSAWWRIVAAVLVRIRLRAEPIERRTRPRPARPRPHGDPRRSPAEPPAARADTGRPHSLDRHLPRTGTPLPEPHRGCAAGL